MRSSPLFFFAAFLFACSSTPAGDGLFTNEPEKPGEIPAPPQVPPSPPGDEALAWKTCSLIPAQNDQAAECAIDHAPRDYADPNGARIELGVKRVVQTSAPKAQLWLVDGGPGGSAVNAFSSLARRIRQNRPDIELYAVDHRGVGGSHPLECPAQESASSEGGATVTPAEWRACAAHLAASEAEWLPHINTTNSMRDLARLVDRVRKPNVPVFVYGGSYGTYAVLRYLALFPKQPDGVILEGISPPGRNFDPYDREMNGVAQRIFELCKGEATCAAHLGPDPWATASQVVASFGEGHCPQLGLDADGARTFLGSFVMFAPIQSMLPALVYRMQRCEARDRTALVHFYQALSGALGGQLGMSFNDGRRDTAALFFHVAVSEMWHWDTMPRAENVLADWRSTVMSTGLTVRIANVQDVWPKYPRGAEVTAELPAYDGPLLMLQGDLDGATAVQHATRLRDRYKGPSQTWVEFPRGGHQIMEATPLAGGDDCGRRVALAFLDDPRAPLDTSCVANVQTVPFDGTPSLNQLLLGTMDAWD